MKDPKMTPIPVGIMLMIHKQEGEKWTPIQEITIPEKHHKESRMDNQP